MICLLGGVIIDTWWVDLSSTLGGVMLSLGGVISLLGGVMLSPWWSDLSSTLGGVMLSLGGVISLLGGVIRYHQYVSIYPFF